MLLKSFFKPLFVTVTLLYCQFTNVYSQSRGANLICSNQIVNASYNSFDPNSSCNSAYGSIKASVEYDSLCVNFSGTSWEMTLDMWGDGTIDRIASSTFGVQYNGIWTSISRYRADGGININWIKFENRFPHVRLSDLVYFTNIEVTTSLKADIRLPNFNFENVNVDNKVTWTITDACGSHQVCDHTVSGQDIKAPTPYCVSISTVLMQINPRMVEILAKDFDKGAFDNCTVQSDLVFTFEGESPVLSKLNEEHFFKGNGKNATVFEYNCGGAQRWRPSIKSSSKLWFGYGVNDLKVSVWDEKWNNDFCTIVLTSIELNCSILDFNMAGAMGSILSPSGLGLGNFAFDVISNEFESPLHSTVSNNSGSYEFRTNVDSIVSEFILSKEDESLLGVNSLDLIRLQNHLNGSKPLTNVYDLIAADINNDKQINKLDLLDLRKVILGIDNKFKNSSWRFPILYQTIDILQPFSYLEKQNLVAGLYTWGIDFVAVKIGDIDGDVNQKLTDTAIKTRTKHIVPFYLNEDSATKDQMIDVPVYASDLKEVVAYQLRLKLKDARFMSVNPSNKGNLDFAILDDNTLSLSWIGGDQNYDFGDDEVLFTITLSSQTDAKISEMISIDSNGLLPQIYHTDMGEVEDLKLEVRGGPDDEVVLYQNEPNPFVGQASIAFKLPKTGLVTLKVFNSLGREIISRSINAIEGINIEIISADELNGVGMYIYHLQCEDFAATRKMIFNY